MSGRGGCALSQKPGPRAAALRPRLLPSPSLLSSQSHEGLAPGGPRRLRHHTLGSDFKGGFPNSTPVTALSTRQVLSVPCSVPRDEVSSLFLQNEPDGGTDLTLSPAPETTLGASDTVKHNEVAQETSRLPHTLVSRSPQHCLPHSPQHLLGPQVAFDDGGCDHTLALHGLADDRQRNCDPCRQLPLQRKKSRFIERRRQEPPPSVTQGPQEPGGSLRGPVFL